MNIRNFDLNLLIIYKDLILTKSVSHTALNLGLSQPAVSHALKRLRESLGDELFIRSGKKLIPTAKTVELGSLISEQIIELEKLLFKTDKLEPKKLDKVFTLSGTSYDAMIWFPRLMGHLKKESPLVKINFKGIVLEKYLERMSSGEVDLSFAGNLIEFTNFSIETLAVHELCLITNKSNKKVKTKISLSDYLAGEHIVYTPTEMPGSYVDEHLASLGHTRNICIKTPYLNAVPELLLQRDYLCIVPKFYAQFLKSRYPIRLLNIPFKMESFTHQMIWHKSKDNASEHEWLRKCIRDNYKQFIK